MKVPTVDQVMLWNIDMGSVAPKAELIAQGIRDAADTMNKTIDGLNWSGQGRHGAEGRADRERTQMRLTAEAFDDLATACRNAQNAMGPMVTTARQTVTTLRKAGYEVNDADWSVRDTYNYQAVRDTNLHDQYENDLKNLQATRANEASNQTVALQRLAADLGWADDAAATAIRTALNSIEQLTPATSALNPTLAAQDEAALRNGTATPEQVQRLQLATQLTQQQLDELLAGEQVHLPQGQFDYLRGLMRSMDTMSVTDIKNLGDTLPADQQTIVRAGVADALQIMSNPQIDTAGNLGGEQKIVGDTGGMGLLPTQVRTLLTEKPYKSLNPARGGGAGGVIEVPRMGDFNALTDLLGKGNTSLAQGADIDRGLLKQGAEIAGSNVKNIQGPWGSTETPSSLADKMLSRAGIDHLAVHDLLTGGAKLPDGTHRMDVTVAQGGKYDPDSHIGNLLNHNWEGRDAGIATVVTTAGEFATSPIGAQRVDAGESAYALASYMSKHEDELLHINSFEGRQEIGIANPALTQALASTLSPYIPDMVSINPDLLHTSGFTHDFSPQSVKNIFAVIDSDPIAAKQFNASAYAAVSQLNQQFGTTDAHNYQLVEWAGKIDAAARDGMQLELDTRKLDGKQQLTATTALFDSTREVTAFTIKRVPVIGDALELAVKASSPEVKAWLLGSVPEVHSTIDLSGNANPSQRYYNILEGMTQTADPADFRSDPYIGKYFDSDGKLKSLEEIAGTDPGRYLPEFDSAMRNRLPGLANYDASWTLGHNPNGLPPK
ncbi:TPR repeat region-containing protein [Nocardia acidivorans]|uniref:TPR repeat region-containing protein n=1 Tax=Nocardia acidivorans TaxID=404580 RepID=UPI0008343659|nr:hypothetical protein [Nocardia acidivorans]